MSSTIQKNIMTLQVVWYCAYEYTNTNWEDQLTKFNNTVITYDAIGNPVTIGDTHLTWINGRQLNKYQDSNYTIDYKYNDNGIRTKK